VTSDPAIPASPAERGQRPRGVPELTAESKQSGAMASAPELYGQAIAMQHAGVSWHDIALRLEELAGARAIDVVYQITFDTGEIIQFNGTDWLCAGDSRVSDQSYVSDPSAAGTNETGF
jgi:hypothetical protein